MAELFLARVAGPQSFEKLVVLKKILPKFAGNPRFLQLFDDEARLAASLSHKNIVAVHDIGGSGAEHFFAMEYLHGQDVRNILHRAWRLGEKLPIQFAVMIASHVASALHYAHEKRRPDGSLIEIVHRDVSPSNVIVSYDGAVKLVDFGVAKASTRTVKTRTGTLKGKIAYMSPEQARGAAIDRRSDVFSLGIVLWEMITTTRLFRGENDLATLQLIINMPIKRPSEERPDTPPDLERIVLKALAQDVEKRYQTANELARDLEELVRTEQLAQSSSALSVYMSELFRPELDSWEVSRAQGVALGEHLTNVGDLTTPVSESAFIEPIESVDLEEEEDENDESLDAVAGTIDPVPKGPATVARTPTGPVPRPPTLPARPATPSARSSAPVLASPTDVTEIGPPIDEDFETLRSAQAVPVPAPPPVVQQRATTPAIGAAVVSAGGGGRADTTEHVKPLPPPGVARQRDSSPWPNAPTPHGGLAHGSWPQNVHAVGLPDANELPFSQEQARKLKQQFKYVGIGLLVLVLLLAIVKPGGGGEQSAAAGSGGTDDTGSDTVEPVQRETTPPPVKTPAAVPPDAAVAPVEPPVDAAVVEEPVDAAVPQVKKPPPPTIKKPRPTIKKPPPTGTSGP